MAPSPAEPDRDRPGAPPDRPAGCSGGEAPSSGPARTARAAYGEAVVLNRVDVLSPEEYREIAARQDRAGLDAGDRTHPHVHVRFTVRVPRRVPPGPAAASRRSERPPRGGPRRRSWRSTVASFRGASAGIETRRPWSCRPIPTCRAAEAEVELAQPPVDPRHALGPLGVGREERNRERDRDTGLRLDPVRDVRRQVHADTGLDAGRHRLLPASPRSRTPRRRCSDRARDGVRSGRGRTRRR